MSVYSLNQILRHASRAASAVLFTNISYADLIKPNSNLKPFDVLSIQLNSLKDNNNPYKDAGVEQTWEFAHPINKTFTGPLERFKQIIYSDNN